MVTPSWGQSAQRYEVVDLGDTNRPGVIVPLVGPGQRVLDVGCGIGSTAELLVANGCTVVGVELDPGAAARASAHCERVVICDLDTSDLAAEVGDDEFDVVLTADVLEHLRDPGRLLAAAARLLRPGGRVVASIPNVAHGSVRLALLHGDFQYSDMGILDRTHLRFFTRQTVEDVFAEAGLRIDQLDRTVVPVRVALEIAEADLPPGSVAAVEAMPEADTYQFVVTATTDPEAPPQATAAAPDSAADAAAGSAAGDRVLVHAQAEALRALQAEVAELHDRLRRAPMYERLRWKLRHGWRR